MMKRRFATAALAAATVAFAGTAGAAIYTVDFTVAATDANPWFAVGSGDNPFGLSGAPVLNGSFQVNDATRVGDSSGTSSISNLDYTTGTMTWSIAGLDGKIGFTGQDLTGFSLIWGPQNYVMSSNTVQIHDPATGQGLACNGCVTFTATEAAGVAEPASWALVIAGFGGVGAMLRRRVTAAA